MTAPTFTNLTANGGSSATSFTTASVTPTGNRLILVSVHAYISTGSVAPTAPTVTGNGITYTQIGTGQDVDNAGTDRAKLFIFRGMAASPTAGAITISFGATTMTRCFWVVDQSDANVDTTGTNGSGAIFTSPPVGATPAAGTSASVTYSPSMTSGNSGYAAVAHQTNEQVTPRSGWTELADTFPVTLGNLETQYIAGTDTAASGTWTTSARSGIIALEIQPPVAGPTITPFQTSDWTSTGTPKTISVTGAVTGDKIVVLYGGDNGGSVVTDATVTTTGGSTSAWTEPEEGLAAGNQAWISSSVADVTASGTITVNLSRTQGTADPWGGWAALVHNHNGIGVHARSAPSATETVTLTGVTQDSAVLLLGIDWDDLANVLFSPGGATDVQRSFGTNVAWYAGYWRGQASGTRGYGIATSSTTNLHIIAIEALAASSSLTGTSTLAATATLTAAGTVATGATLTGTAGVSATGSVVFSGGSTQPVAAGLTAAGSAGRSTGAALGATAGIVAAGGSTASTTVPVTTTITAAGLTSGSNAASLAVTSTVSLAAAATGSAVLPVTAAVSAAGNVATSSGASLPVAAAVTASSGGGTSSGSALAVTGAVTATGNLAASGTAAASTAASVSAAGVVGKSTGAALAVTAGTSAAGVAAYQGQASLTVTSTVTAAPAGAGLSSGSTTAVTSTITTAGVVSGGSTVSITATVTAAGSTGSPAFTGSATPVFTVAVTAAGVVGKSSTAAAPVTVTLAASGSANLQRSGTLIVAAVIAAAGVNNTTAPGTASAAVGPVPHSDPGSMTTPAASAGSMTVPTATGG